MATRRVTMAQAQGRVRNLRRSFALGAIAVAGRRASAAGITAASMST